MHMEIFLIDCAWTLLSLIGFAIVGGFTLHPFRHSVKYFPCFAPLGGMLYYALGMAWLIGIFNVRMQTAFYILAVIGVLLTGMCYIRKPLRIGKNFYKILTISLLTILTVTYLTHYLDIQFGQHTLLYLDGTDHLGYTGISDWVLQHGSRPFPVNDPHFPAQSYTYFGYHCETRFGIFYITASLLYILGISPPFAYATILGVILSAGILAIASVYARSVRIFGIVVVSVLLSQLFVLGGQGYLAKVFSFGSFFALLGLIFTLEDPIDHASAAIIGFFTIAVAISYSALALGMLLVFSAFLYACIQTLDTWVTQRSSRDWGKILFAVFLITVAISQTGMFRKAFLDPCNFMFVRDIFLGWKLLTLSMFGIKHCSAMAVWPKFPAGVAWVLTGISCLISMTTLAIAIYKKNWRSVTLCIAPFAIIIALLVMLHGGYPRPQLKGYAYRLISVYYLFFILSIISLLDAVDIKEVQAKSLLWRVLLSLLLLMIGIRIPRFVGDVKRYTGIKIPKTQQFLQHEINHLVNLIGHKVVVIDTHGPNTIFILNAFDGRKMHLQWTPRAWKSAVGYQPWEPPSYNHHNKLWLRNIEDVAPNMACKILYTSQQFKLYDCSLVHWILTS